MIRVTATAAGLTLSSIACVFAPLVIADPGSAQYVRTQSGAVRCLVMASDQRHGGAPGVACEHGPGFPQAPMSRDGTHLDLAVIHASGDFNWDDGNIGGGGTPQNDLVLNYGQTYHLQGWTINPGEDGTRFSNDGTGHGMFVSIDNVSSF